jgi:hypothetical protein
MELLSRFVKGRGGVGGRVGGHGSGENWTGSRARMEPRLVDYELILGEDGKRCVGFGWFAGGMSLFSLLFYLFRPCTTSSSPLFLITRIHLSYQLHDPSIALYGEGD